MAIKRFEDQNVFTDQPPRGDITLTWAGKESRAAISSGTLVEDRTRSYCRLRDDIADSADNLLIHGDNLSVLENLGTEFAGKLNCIFIDPPYNTGNSFEHYSDDTDHCAWLTATLHQLIALRRLLRFDGLIFAQADDNEGQYLRIIMDEVFGRQNFVTTFVWRKVGSHCRDLIRTPNHEYIFCYALDNARAVAAAKVRGDFGARKSPFRNVWSTSGERDTKTAQSFSSIWEDLLCTEDARTHLARLLPNVPVFATPKPEPLLRLILELATSPGDFVLDAFLGSGTTAAVAHKMRRRWIGIEVGEHCHTICLPRLTKVVDGDDPGGITSGVKWSGGGRFRYFTFVSTGPSGGPAQQEIGHVRLNASQ